MPASSALRRAAFIDRDGVINIDHGYTYRCEDFAFVPGSLEACAQLHRWGFALVVVTNQSGIARGLYGEAEYSAVQERLLDLLAAEGVTIDASEHCPHHPEFSGPCDCRKPGLAMFRRAAETLGIDTGASVFIGDRTSDVAPAARLGGKGILVLTGYGREQLSEVPPDVQVAADLAAAADLVLGPAGG